MNRVREPFNVNSLAQVAAAAALDDKMFLKRTKNLLKEEKVYLYKNFKRLGLKYVPSATNFILVDIKKDSSEIFRKLLRLGVIVRDMKAWKLNTFIRVSIGTKAENRKFIKALEKSL
jgi:histidinol-phosphate aminotransferase